MIYLYIENGAFQHNIVTILILYDLIDTTFCYLVVEI